MKNVEKTQATNGGNPTIALSRPYQVRVQIQGVAPMLMHGWNCEAVQEKSVAAKGSKAKKSDDIESYVYRTPDGFLGIPGTYLHASLKDAAKFLQDPRSPRKSARDLVSAAVITLTTIAPFEPKTKTWDYEDRRRVQVQRNGITRTRPAMKEGWRLSFDLLITLPEYVNQEFLARLVTDAGRLCGLADHRPTYGRFAMTGFEVRADG